MEAGQYATSDGFGEGSSRDAVLKIKDDAYRLKENIIHSYVDPSK